MYHCTTQENISMHISNIYADGELDKEGTYKKFLLVRQEGKRHPRQKYLLTLKGLELYNKLK